MRACGKRLGRTARKASNRAPTPMRPMGVNFLLAGPYCTRGALSFDTSLPVTDPQPKTSNAVLGYARALDPWGKSGKFDVIVPHTWLSGTASYQGDAADGRGPSAANLLQRVPNWRAEISISPWNGRFISRIKKIAPATVNAPTNSAVMAVALRRA